MATRHREIIKKLKMPEKKQITGEILADFNLKKAHKTLFEALLTATRKYGSYLILEDTSQNPKTEKMDYKKLLVFSTILSEKLKSYTAHKERVGILMPNVNVTLALFFALSKLGRIPTMLSFITTAQIGVACCKTAQVKTVFTARSFLEKATKQGDGRPQKIVTLLEEKGIKVIYLEDIVKNITGLDKLKGLFLAYYNLFFYKAALKPEEEAVVLFTSGSEGEPKGVALSHINILANHLQSLEGMQLRPKEDVLFNALPNFHCFGLLTSLLLPIFNGVKVCMHTNPKDVENIPGYIQKWGATLTFTTNSFLEAYAAEVLKKESIYRKETFERMRYIWAGAEALKEETRLLWLEKFNVEVMQGYGVTETSPVAAVNYPKMCKHGTIGRLVGGTAYMLDPVDGIENGYELCLKGPHVMLGYIYPGEGGKVRALGANFHRTGDVVYMDDEGYLKILGRLSRFIKVKGEKVPLSVAEGVAKNRWPKAVHGAGKGTLKNGREAIILFTTQLNPSLKELEQEMGEQNIPLRHMPKAVVFIEEIPLLGSGKLDLVGLDILAKAHIQKNM